MNYWDERYKSGGTSGCGSIGKLKEWKWQIIMKYCPILPSVVDVGCGDMTFWEGKILPLNYTGIDISQEIITRNQKKYPFAKFKVTPSVEILNYTTEIVFCFDMLFHIMDEDEYYKTLENCCKYSTHYIFVYTWLINPLKKWKFFTINKDSYQRYYNPITLDQIITSQGFTRIALEQSKEIDRYGAMFIYKKI